MSVTIAAKTDETGGQGSALLGKLVIRYEDLVILQGNEGDSLSCFAVITDTEKVITRNTTNGEK